jgi:kynureninase
LFVKFLKILHIHTRILMKTIYLDCNATTPLEPEVRDKLLYFLTEEFGNEGSRTHEYGAQAKQAVQKARDQVAAVVAAQRDEVIFTSGATESNNLAILGLQAARLAQGKRHVITSYRAQGGAGTMRCAGSGRIDRHPTAGDRRGLGRPGGGARRAPARYRADFHYADQQRNRRAPAAAGDR